MAMLVHITVHVDQPLDGAVTDKRAKALNNAETGWRTSSRTSGRSARFLVASKNEGLEKAQNTPNSQECEAFERETLELKEKLGDHERDQERNRLLPDGNPDSKVLDK
jgi:hypothetical protein